MCQAAGGGARPREERSDASKHRASGSDFPGQQEPGQHPALRGWAEGLWALTWRWQTCSLQAQGATAPLRGQAH